MKLKIKNSFILKGGNVRRRERGCSITNDFYLCFERACVMPESTSKEYIIGREDSFHCEKT